MRFMKNLNFVMVAVCLAIVIAPHTAGAQARSVLDGVYAPAQAASGLELYPNACAGCHGAALGGGAGPQLAGATFVSRWKDKTVGDLFEKIKTTMPAGMPNTLSPDATADLVSFILKTNNYAS